MNLLLRGKLTAFLVVIGLAACIGLDQLVAFKSYYLDNLSGTFSPQALEILSKVIDPYYLQILIYVGINIILASSLNVVNGYMGEFSVGHAAFMAVGAYAGSLVTVGLFKGVGGTFAFPIALLAGGIAAGFFGLLVAIPSFKTRGDYLAIVTLALNMIVKSVIENIPGLGGPQGYSGMARSTNLAWTFFCVVATIWCIRNLIYSRYGRSIIAVREDEIAAELVGVNTRNAKILAFVISSFFAGIAGVLFAHLIQFINPRTFSVLKSTDVLVMLYLGGAGTMGGPVLGAIVYTIALELLRFLGIWRFVVTPLLLILLMILRPTGIVGGHEIGPLIPTREKEPCFPTND
ncbi:MAG: branched-chain amino acid ABC transporter permease [Candidatus Riflebacteria bacterium]|nr:branched-chain amino acid ABC transporter permease [Candidatus Riflebacteria bacterium]